MSIASLLFLSGCEFINKAEDTYQSVKNEYNEYRGEGKDERGEKPFTVIYQEDESKIGVLVSSSCAKNDPVGYVYYETPTGTANYLRDITPYIATPGIGNVKPYWDIRYVNPVNKYIDGGVYNEYPDHGIFTGLDVRSGVRNIGVGTYASTSDAQGGIAQSECIDGILAAGTTINLNDAPEQSIFYGGPQSTFAYWFSNSNLLSPWHSNQVGNLVLQGYFDKPLYYNYEDNLGGGVYFNVILKNKNSNIFLNYVIGIYAMGTAWQQEKAGIQYDPTTNIVHIATVVNEKSWWSTKSPRSQELQEITYTKNQKTSDNGIWYDFYRVNISYQNLLEVLKELKNNPPSGAENIDYGLNPADWEVSLLAIQYELEEGGGKATLSGSFKGFEAYFSDFPI